MLTHLDCTKCEKQYEPGRVLTVCSCGAPLYARYDLSRAAHEMRPGQLALREPTMWRYREVLPLGDDKNKVSLGEGFTPLLDAPLKGPVYLRTSDNLLPDVVAALRGQVEIDLDGRVDQVRHRMRTTFDVVPDVPVSKFSLTVRGGRKGLLENSVNLCAHRYKVIAKFTAQNGKPLRRKPKLRTPCKQKKSHRRRR